MNPASNMTKFSYQVLSFTQSFSKIDAKAYVRRHLYVFLWSYRTKHVQALVLILQSYSQTFIELKAHWLKFSKTDLDH